LIHFAVSNTEVAMVTKLAGPATVFLPFNLGDDGAAGNPVNTAGGHRTAYLWEQVWARESWLEILGRYLIAQRDKRSRLKSSSSRATTSWTSPASCKWLFWPMARAAST
jgi:type I restriction enzyme R subunit